MKTVYLQRDPEEWQQFVELLEQAVKEEKLEQFFSLFLTSDERGSEFHVETDHCSANA